jgi:6-phosphogluconolactonase
VHGSIHIFDDIDSLLDALVDQWREIGAEAIADHGAFHVALAGGGTPQHFYERLAHIDLENSVEWDKVHLYFGDERCVPPDHKDSNYRMAREALFSRVAIPASQIHAMFSPELDAEQNAACYASLLERQLTKDVDGRPVFDLVYLGMGEDGHTASLFPGTEILNETVKSVAAQFVDKLGVWRISLTYPTINAARHVSVLVVGDSKATVLSEISTLSQADIRYPIQRINPQTDLHWFVDAAAAHLVGDDAYP